MAAPDRVRDWLDQLRVQRKRCGILLMDTRTLQNGGAAALAGNLGLARIDLVDALLPTLTEDSLRPLGVFSPDDLLAWLRTEAYHSDRPLVVEGVEAVLATFPRQRTATFFRLLANADVRSPLILATYLSALLEASVFPSTKILRLAEYNDDSAAD